MEYLLLLGLLASCGNNSPKFKVGDCTVFKSELDKQNEFLPSDNMTIRKILNVGKRNYLYEFKDGLILEVPFEELDETSSVKINCPKGE